MQLLDGCIYDGALGHDSSPVRLGVTGAATLRAPDARYIRQLAYPGEGRGQTYRHDVCGRNPAILRANSPEQR
jgi:hypothetical protein